MVYPESAPNDWIRLLREQCVPALIFPLYDKDLNAGETLKKGHYHVMILFDSVKTSEQEKEVFEVIGGIGIQPIKSAKAYARYLYYLDNPEKAQYDIENVVSCSYADYQTMISITTDKYSAIGEMIESCL
ncbi:MAG: replication protein [Lachnospiraceae bacterium]|nr:replication protein [Lachnospiraceae bacterium]